MNDAGSKFIPFVRSELLGMLKAEGRLSSEDGERFGKLTEIFASIFNFSFQRTLDELKDNYECVNPDADRPAPDGEPGDGAGRESRLLCALEHVLSKANYDRIGEDELRTSLSGEGVLPLSMKVEFDDFEYFRVYRQGLRRESVELRRPFFLLKPRRRVIDLYDRVVAVIKYKNEEYLSRKYNVNLKRRVSSFFSASALPGAPGRLCIKLFRAVPALDLEIVFPGARPRMKLLDTLKVAFPIILGLALVLYKFVVDPFVLDNVGRIDTAGSAAFIAAASLLWNYAQKTMNGYRIKIHEIMNEVSTHLYFKTAATNAGVFANLIDLAEEEEFKEAVLAYFFLLTAGEPLARQDLDRCIEAWFRERHGVGLDFEVDDALGKLANFGLVSESADRWVAVPLGKALETLDRVWDDFFDFNRKDGPVEFSS